MNSTYAVPSHCSGLKHNRYSNAEDKTAGQRDNTCEQGMVKTVHIHAEVIEKN